MRKLLLFAHVPPPHHGQSFMVEMLLKALGGDARFRDRKRPHGEEASSQPAEPAMDIACYHVDSRFSNEISDVGHFRTGKLLLLLKYCLQAIYFRWKFKVTAVCYVPAPGLRPAVYRDWLILALCRPFFKTWIFHWHSAGLADWLTHHALPWERWLTKRILRQPDLSIVLGESCRGDPAAVESRRTVVIPNGIPDPCPEFTSEILPQRESDAQFRAGLLATEPAMQQGATRELHFFRLLFLGLCCREKGVFDAVEAVAILNAKLAARHSDVRIQLCVAGRFYREAERIEFEARIREPDLVVPVSAGPRGPSGQRFGSSIRYLGFVSGDQKKRLFRECGCFCFPTYYPAESFPLVLLEAMAYGMDIITTAWRNIPELLPNDYPGLVTPCRPDQIAMLIEHFSTTYTGSHLRERFEQHYTKSRWLARMVKALGETAAPHKPCPSPSSASA